MKTDRPARAAAGRVALAEEPRPSRRRRRRSSPYVQVASDLVVAGLAFLLSYWLRYHVYPTHNIPGGEPPDLRHYFAVTPLVAASVPLIFGFMGSYRFRRGVQFIDELFSVLGAMAVTFLVVLAAVGLYREPHFTYSRLTLFYWFLVASVLIGLARYAIRRVQASRRSHASADRALVVGSGAAADLLIQRIRMFPDYGYRLLGVVADDMREGAHFSGVRVLGGTDKLRNLANNRDVGVIFIALSDVSQDRVLELVDSCEGLETEFRIVPSMLEIMTTRVTADQLDGIPLLQFRAGLEVDTGQVAVKRAFDFLVALLGLILISPLLALVALAVRLSSPGPVLLHQERIGQGGRVFLMHKFRTMRADAELETGPVWADSRDPRRTPVGRFLRRFSLDELPQLWNVVRGDMSMVGPRPERPVFVAEFDAKLPTYMDRHRVRPGVTGWAQVNDLRGRTPIEERLIYDLYYIENWSLAFDLKIILITLFRVFTHKNAY